MGVLSVNGRPIGYTLERAWVANITDVSSIQGERTYKAFVRTRAKKGKNGKTTEDWRLELKNVPGRDNAQIHIGNWIDPPDPRQQPLKGCIEVGIGANAHTCTVQNSGGAIGNLKKAVEASINPACPDPEIIVEIRGKAKGEKKMDCTPFHQCLQVVEVIQGKKCGNPRSLFVRVRNACEQRVRRHICFHRLSGKWQCGTLNQNPGEESFFYKCDASEYRLAAFHPKDPLDCIDELKNQWSQSSGVSVSHQ